MNYKEEIFLNYVRRELNSGKTEVTIPNLLLIDVNDEVLVEVRRMGELAGVSFNIVA